MWAKILAGSVAALLVVGFGVWVALPPGVTSANGPCNKCCDAPQVECDDAVSVCYDGPLCPSVTCCAAKPVDADALAACAGGMAVSPAPVEASRTNAKFKCCAEE
jgi:hypothetical protein